MTRPETEPATSRSQSRRSTTEPLCRCPDKVIVSPMHDFIMFFIKLTRATVCSRYGVCFFFQPKLLIFYFNAPRQHMLWVPTRSTQRGTSDEYLQHNSTSFCSEFIKTISRGYLPLSGPMRFAFQYLISHKIILQK